MNYLLDKKSKKKKILIFIVLVFLLCLFIYLNTFIFNGLSYLSHIIFRPVLVAGNNLTERIQNIFSLLDSKKALLEENNVLKSKIEEFSGKISNYESILNENMEMKEILERRNENRELILGVILTKPNRSVYDTLIIDAGEEEGIKNGSLVLAFGNIPIGKIAEVFPHSSKVLLFSNPGEKTEVVIGNENLFIEAIGRGGGNFEVNIPRNIILKTDDEAVLPGINSLAIAKVKTVISDPRDSFQKALLVSPVNIQKLKFVQVEK